MRKDTHKVSFIAEVPQPTKVKFKTKDGEKVDFIAIKDRLKRVKFFAKNKR